MRPPPAALGSFALGRVGLPRSGSTVGGARGRGPWAAGRGLWVGSPPGPPWGGVPLASHQRALSRAPFALPLGASPTALCPGQRAGYCGGHQLRPSPPQPELQGAPPGPPQGHMQGACQAAQGPPARASERLPSFFFKKKKNYKVKTKQPRPGAAGGRKHGGGPCVRTLARQPSQSHPHGEGGEGGEL